MFIIQTIPFICIMRSQVTKQLADLCDDARYNKLRKCPGGYLCTFLHSLRAGLEASDETGEATVHVSSVGQKLGVDQPRVHRVTRDTSSWNRQGVMCAICTCTCVQLAIMLNHAFTKYCAVEVMT